MDRFPHVDLIKFHFPRIATPQMGEAYVKIMKNEFSSPGRSWQGNFSDDEYLSAYENIDADLIYMQIRELLNRPRTAVLGPIEKDRIALYFQHPEITPAGACACFSSLAVQPNGDAVCCGDYPDYVLGNIKHEKMVDIWRGEKATKWRQYLKENGNFGVLSKCSRLYKTIPSKA